jgi:hypothetical protein
MIGELTTNQEHTEIISKAEANHGASCYRVLRLNLTGPTTFLTIPVLQHMCSSSNVTDSKLRSIPQSNLATTK